MINENILNEVLAHTPAEIRDDIELCYRRSKITDEDDPVFCMSIFLLFFQMSVSDRLDAYEQEFSNHIAQLKLNERLVKEIYRKEVRAKKRHAWISILLVSLLATVLGFCIYFKYLISTLNFRISDAVTGNLEMRQINTELLERLNNNLFPIINSVPGNSSPVYFFILILILVLLIIAVFLLCKLFSRETESSLDSASCLSRPSLFSRKSAFIDYIHKQVSTIKETAPKESTLNPVENEAAELNQKEKQLEPKKEPEDKLMISEISLNEIMAQLNRKEKKRVRSVIRSLQLKKKKTAPFPTTNRTEISKG